ncbi:hypothetical protein ITQ94_08910 [Pediococcus pentosaceus]|jgi:hypothetical protein|uniref:hypothetical protein n=1 Tax=Pediococcus pentosaceus TaxID=1255 RepID=UPI0018FEC2F2|nr:hypothetical protein [Pediococcus pentosaceus]MBF7131555.1 hypothetical protein [Pediococcus pentosaceus]
MKKFESYKEQVNYSVESMVLFNKYTEVSENWFEYAPTALTTEDESGYYEDVYQWYAVEICRETEETERLGIFYDEDLGIYILPVTDFGTPWEGVPAVDFSESVEG